MPSVPGNRVAALRRSYGLTQGGLAFVLGVHPMTVSKWERGQAIVTSRTQPWLQLLQRAAVPAWLRDQLAEDFANKGAQQARGRYAGGWEPARVPSWVVIEYWRRIMKYDRPE